jgi:hypothetical protein
LFFPAKKGFRSHVPATRRERIIAPNPDHLPLRKMYLSETRPSPTGNEAWHFTQPNLLLCKPFGTSIVTMMYFAPQLGQSKAIGSDFLQGNARAFARKKQKAALNSCWFRSKMDLLSHGYPPAGRPAILFFCVSGIYSRTVA